MEAIAISWGFFLILLLSLPILLPLAMLVAACLPEEPREPEVWELESLSPDDYMSLEGPTNPSKPFIERRSDANL